MTAVTVSPAKHQDIKRVLRDAVIGSALLQDVSAPHIRGMYLVGLLLEVDHELGDLVERVLYRAPLVHRTDADGLVRAATAARDEYRSNRGAKNG